MATLLEAVGHREQIDMLSVVAVFNLMRSTLQLNHETFMDWPVSCNDTR